MNNNGGDYIWVDPEQMVHAAAASEKILPPPLSESYARLGVLLGLRGDIAPKTRHALTVAHPNT